MDAENIARFIDAANLCRRVAKITASPRVIPELLSIADKFEAEARELTKPARRQRVQGPGLGRPHLKRLRAAYR